MVCKANHGAWRHAIRSLRLSARPLDSRGLSFRFLFPALHSPDRSTDRAVLSHLPLASRIDGDHSLRWRNDLYAGRCQSTWSNGERGGACVDSFQFCRKCLLAWVMHSSGTPRGVSISTSNVNRLKSECTGISPALGRAWRPQWERSRMNSGGRKGGAWTKATRHQAPAS